METEFLLLSLLYSALIVCSNGSLHSPTKDIKTVEHDFFNFPATTITTTPPTNPLPTPVTVPPDTSTPVIITVPSSTPTPVTLPPPSAPVPVPPTTPSTNPIPTPVVTNPVTTPVVAPPASTTAPGQSWCVAKTGAPEKSLQSALDYACGIGKADCSAIQQGASCYNPNTLQSHASVAFNNYYQKNPVPTSCDFGSTAMITTANPSSGSCIFTSSPSSSSPTTSSPTTSSPTTASPTTSSPTTASPTTTPPTSFTTPPTNPTSTPATLTPVPTTSSSTGAAPTGSTGAIPGLLNGSYPGLGGDSSGFGLSPQGVNMTSSVSKSSNLHQFIGSILVVAFVITGGMVFDI